MTPPRDRWLEVVRTNDDASVLALVETHQKIINASPDTTVLCAAVLLGRVELVERLIQLGHKALPTERPLTAALQVPNNTLRILESLLRMPDFSWRHETTSPHQLNEAIFPRRPSLALLRLMKSVLTPCERYRDLFSAHSFPSFDTPMLVAARLNDTAVVEWLLDQGIRPVSDRNNGTCVIVSFFGRKAVS